MQKIHASKLAEMLGEGFEGNVNFSGRVFASEGSEEFFGASGKFVLYQENRDIHPPRERRRYNLSLGTEEEGSSFVFSLDGPAKYDYPEKYGDLVSRDIAFPGTGTFQIEPQDIMY